MNQILHEVPRRYLFSQGYFNKVNKCNYCDIWYTQILTENVLD
ncbi:unnamed protein product [Paramecium sonneborni]|uniref:Uncharacterized protein n=1 Tax=Paramecium sonneborni TaxID=65129 RepID=A0A8S1PP10_9CILI|nr:unnamed protein product [Paramecium sonneborni]